MSSSPLFLMTKVGRMALVLPKDDALFTYITLVLSVAFVIGTAPPPRWLRVTLRAR